MSKNLTPGRAIDRIQQLKQRRDVQVSRAIYRINQKHNERVTAILQQLSTEDGEVVVAALVAADRGAKATWQEETSRVVADAPDGGGDE